MRLLYLCSDFGIPPDGVKGASIHLRAITRALSDLGYEMMLLSPKAGPSNGHPVKTLLGGTTPHGHRVAKMLKQWLNQRDLRDGAARELRSLLYNATVFEQALVELGSQTPAAIIERLSLFSHLGVDLAEAIGVPLIVEVNAPLTAEAESFRSLQLNVLAKQIEERVLARADAVVCVSQALADMIVAQGVDAAKVFVVANGVDPALFADLPSREVCKKALGLDGSFVVGFAGSLKPWHGVDVLLEAFAELHGKHADARLLIVGTGPAEGDLRRQAKGLGIDQAVMFTGAIPHDTVPKALRAMDVATAPFQTMRNFYFSPIKLFEYMASEAAVVASRMGQIEDVIEDGVDGRLCAPDDAKALAAILEELKRSAQVRCEMGAKARAKVLAHHTWRDTGKAVMRVVNGTLNHKNRGRTSPSPIQGNHSAGVGASI